MSEPMPSSFIIFVAVALIVVALVLWLVSKIITRGRRAESEWRCAASGCNAPQGECSGVCPPCNHDCRQGRACTKKSA